MFNFAKSKHIFIIPVLAVIAGILILLYFFLNNFADVSFVFRIAILTLDDLIKWLHYNASLIDAFAMIILVIITCYYAVETHKLAVQAKRQADNALISERYNEQLELVNKLYGPLFKDWIEPLNNSLKNFSKIQDNLEVLKFPNDFVDIPWESCKLKLSYYVFRLNNTYLNKIEEINNELEKYEKDELGVSKALNQISLNIKKLFLPYFLPLNEQFNPQMMKIDNPNDFKLLHNSLITGNNINKAFFSKENLEQIKDFLQNNLSEDIKIDYKNENKTDTVIKTIKSEDLLQIIKKSEDFIKENKELKSLGEFLKELNNDVIKLKNDMKYELSKKRDDIVKEIKTI